MQLGYIRIEVGFCRLELGLGLELGLELELECPYWITGMHRIIEYDRKNGYKLPV